MAETAVVGILRAMLTADTASFDTGMRKAEQTTLKVGQSISGLEKEVAKLTPQAERMVKSLGGDKLLYTANSLTQAITKIGGATKLTEAEQARANRTLSDAIAKYTALGQKAPQAMVDLERATRGAVPSTLSLSTAISGVGAALAASFSIGAVVGFARSMGQFAGEMKDLSSEVGIGVERLQALNYIGAGVGLTIQNITGSATMLADRLGSGDKSAIAALRRMGIAAEDLKGQSLDEVLFRIGDGAKTITDQNEKIALFRDLFGRSGSQMLRLYQDDLRSAAMQAERTGAVISKELIDKADEFDDKWSQAIIRVKAGLVSVAAAWLTPPGAKAEQAAAQWSRMIDALAAKSGKVLKFNELIAPAGPTDAELQAILAQSDALLKTGRAADVAAQRLRQLKVAHDELLPSTDNVRLAFERYVQVGNDANDTLKKSIGFFTAMPPAIASAADSINADLIPAMQDLAGLTGAPQIESEGASQGVAAQVREVSEAWAEFSRRITDTVQTLRTAISGTFAQMMLGAKTFKDGFLDIWQSIKHALINIFAQIADSFIGGVLKRIVGALAGGGGGGGIGGGLSQLAGGAALGGLLGGGATATAVGSTVTGTGLAGVGGAAGGLGATMTALATNPLTWAAAGGLALAWAIGKKGLFRGGEEGVVVNPKRDLFLAQFGGPGTGSDSGFMQLAAKLTQFTGEPGGGHLHAALRSASTYKGLQSAEDGIIAEFAKHGITNIQKFSVGGWVPPGVVQPAILHGGSMGEIVAPISKLAESGGPRVIHNHYWSLHAMDGESVGRVFREQILPRFKTATELNTDDIAGHFKRVLA